MNIFQSIILGIVQGLTEFLPVSSSAHLVFLQDFFNLKIAHNFLLTFDVTVHLGTLFAVCLAFRNDCINFIKCLVPKSDIKAESRKFYHKLLILLFISTIPAVFAGLMIKDFIEPLLTNSFYAAFFLIITGFILLTTKYVSKKNTILIENLSYFKALIIGIFQAFAILPGISRSGSTISCAMILKLDRQLSARYSFLMSIPVIAGAAVLQLSDFFLLNFSLYNFAILAMGFISSFISGYMAILLLLTIIKNEKFYLFSYYCFLLGTVIMLFTK